MSTAINRRNFLQLSALGGGGLLVGFSLFGCKGDKPEGKQPAAGGKAAEAPSKPAGEPVDINAWIRIEPDDTVVFRTGKSEMGQGVLTSMAMVLAEELEADWSKVRSETGPADEKAYGMQITGGSTSIRMSFERLRKTGAAVREMLIAAAAKRWGVEPGACKAENAAVIHAESGKRLRYGELLAEVVTMTAPEAPALKDKKDFRIVGKPTLRLDAVDKVKGTAVFAMDVKRPGAVTAQVARCPIFGGKLGSFDATEAKAVPGVIDVLECPGGVAVVADNYWAAKKGRDALKVTWDAGKSATLSTASIVETLRQVVKNGKEMRKDGDPAATLGKAKRKLDAVYQVPYLAHAAMEPLSCTAEVRADGCDIWVGTQTQGWVQKAAMDITGLAQDKVKVHTTMLGGGFGRRAQTDYVVDAVHLSKALGKPVKTMWSREDDIRGGLYRPISYNEMSGAVDEDGWPIAWVHRIATPAIPSPFDNVKDDVDPSAIEGAANLPYGIGNLLVTYAMPPQPPVPGWFWRSVGSSQNGFITECFLDELCALGGKDPLEVRQRLLADHPRHKKVLEVAAEKAGWGTPAAEGRARGLAVHESFGSFVAQVAEVSIDKGKVRVHKVVCAIDCGEAVNPSTIAAQIESAIVFGLSAALYGKIDIKDGQAVQSNFHDYLVLRMPEMPVIETHIVASGEALGGVGEPGTPPIAPAVANAVRVLTGKPVRSLPITVA